MHEPKSRMQCADHTFVILAYGTSPYLEECVQSLANQTISGQKLIVTSTPNSFITEIGERFEIPILVSANVLEANASGSLDTSHVMADDWNFGLQATCPTSSPSPEMTAYVTLTHQDDVYLPEFLEETLNLFNKYPDTLIAFTNYEEMTETGSIKPRNLTMLVKDILLFLGFGWREAIKASMAKRRMLSFGSPVCCPSVTFNRRRIGDLHFRRDLRTNLDWDYWIKLARRDGGFAYCPRILMRHRIHQASETSRGLVDQARQQEDRQMFESLWPRAIARVLSGLYAMSYKSNRS